MKGAVMKLGQMASYLDLGAPPAVRDALAALQTQSRPMSAAVVARIFVEELGEGPRRIFAEWSPTPFAAASIGQVHRARLLSGEEVAVKVQYPGIAAAIQADLDSAELLHQVAALLFRGLEPGPLMAELRARLGEECDYRREAAHQEAFRALWAGDPEVRIPRVFAALSTARILVTELASGETFATFAARASQREKDRAGACLFRFAFESILRHGLFNADPHPGNYLFDGGGVTFLDFGCTKRFDPAFIARWRALLRALLERDLPRATALTIELGVAPEPDHFDFGFHHRMNATLFEPLLGAGPFRITPAFVERTWRVGWLENRNRFRTNMPSEAALLPRLQWGLFTLLARLSATADWRGQVLELLYTPGEPRPRPYQPEELVLITAD
jgi:predicted unusual protein kinase regulating ubiquinone biosynthesis (AarF/ABC1/UbiB family)